MPDKQPLTLARTAAETTRDNPWPLALLSQKMKAYIDRMSPLWVKGEVVEYKNRPGTKMGFFVLRDSQAQMSITVKCFKGVIDQAGNNFDEGSQVVLYAKPDFYEGSGQLSLFAKEIHTLGIGDVLAQIEQLRKRLLAEGIFDNSHKQALPFLPRKIGLIAGREAKAKHDVIVNAQLRWPSANFEIREVAVQGSNCVREVSQALAELDRIPEVEVIIIARGGGAVEDLLPFSDEYLIRQAYQTRTPLVGAIGHETDCPLLDYVVDYRASTPTDAACKVVPDWREEYTGLQQAITQIRRQIFNRIQQENQLLESLKTRPVMKDPSNGLLIQQEAISVLKDKLTQICHNRLLQEATQLQGMKQTIQALSPQKALERGFSILKKPGVGVVKNAQELKNGDILEARFAKGTAIVTVFGTSSSNQARKNKEE